MRTGTHRSLPLRFLAVGGWNTLFGYLVFAALYALLHDRLHYLVIGLLAHAIAVVNAFVSYRMLVFRSDAPWLAAFVRFNVAQSVVLGTGLVALWFLVDLLDLNPLVAQGLVTMGAVVLSYLAHRHFTFGGR